MPAVRQSQHMEDTQPIYRDFIPEGEDTGPYLNGGFQDFVPVPEPQAEPPVETPEPEEPTPTKGAK